MTPDDGGGGCDDDKAMAAGMMLARTQWMATTPSLEMDGGDGDMLYLVIVMLVLGDDVSMECMQTTDRPNMYGQQTLGYHLASQASICKGLLDRPMNTLECTIRSCKLYLAIIGQQTFIGGG